MHSLFSFCIFLLFSSFILSFDVSHADQQSSLQQSAQTDIIVENVSNLEISYRPLLKCVPYKVPEKILPVPVPASTTGFITLKNKNAKKQIIINDIIFLNPHSGFQIKSESYRIEAPVILSAKEKTSFLIYSISCLPHGEVGISLPTFGPYHAAIKQSHQRTIVRVEWVEQISGPLQQAHFLIEIK